VERPSCWAFAAVAAGNIEGGKLCHSNTSPGCDLSVNDGSDDDASTPERCPFLATRLQYVMWGIRQLPRRFARIVCALTALLSPSIEAAERIPVIAWHGPPANETTLERYRELAEAGFTHNFSSFPDAAAMEKALRVAEAAGIKQFISIPELQKDPEDVAKRFKDDPTVAGYYLRDEPSAGDFPALSKWAGRINSVDLANRCYINLFPNYANAGQLGTATYREHVERFIKEVPVSYVSFDHYPVLENNNVRGEWYENLEVIASASTAAKKPFWAFALAVAHRPYPIPTPEHLRLQVFSNLAYGAQAIQYFTYWTPQSTVWDFHDAPIEIGGRRSVVFDRVKEVNAEITGLSRVFYAARPIHIGHTEPLPRGTRQFEAVAPITAVKSEGGGALISLLEKGDERFLALVNRQLQQAITVTLTFDGSKPIHQFCKDGTTTDVGKQKHTAQVEPGDILVFGWH
jgi:hypothetical protein